jgi:hypothetical protein
MDFGRILKAAETLAHIGQAARRFKAGLDSVGKSNQPGGEDGGGAEAGGFAAEEPRGGDLASGGRMFGQLEARMAGVLVSALKEAFDRDRAHLEMEREQIEHERKRAQELMRLELLRQAGERELQHIRGSVVVTLVVWVASVLFMMLHHSPFGVAGLVLLAFGWLFLLVALAASFASYRVVSGAVLRASQAPEEIVALGRNSLAPVVPATIVLGLGCTAASLLVALATG